MYLNLFLIIFHSVQMHKADGQILINSITKLETEATKGATYPLQVHFKGKAEHGGKSPWAMDLDSNVSGHCAPC